jgi:superoxide dismutase, Cu-Zn family
MTKTPVRTLLALSTAVLALSGCSSLQDGMGAMKEGMGSVRDRMMGSGPSATARLDATRGNATTGTVTFKQHGSHVMVHARISGLKPFGEHGFHVHEKGDCSSGDGMGTGGHFNPTAKPHGAQDADHHAGDMPSLKANAAGSVDVRFHLAGVTLGDGGLTDLAGRGVIVHAGPDDYKTQPTGNSGGRIACGAIEVTKHAH